MYSGPESRSMNTQYNDMDATSKVSLAKMEKTFIFSRVLLIKVHLKCQTFGKGSLNFTIIILPLKTISVTTSHIPSTTAEDCPSLKYHTEPGRHLEESHQAARVIREISNR